MSAENFYDWECNRCETRAHGCYREPLQRFIDHHMATVHPLSTAASIESLFAKKPAPEASR